MGRDKPSLDEFRADIEAVFGQRLTGPAIRAAEDFWNNGSSFSSLISAGSLAVHVDALRLSQNFPRYRQYNVWKGGGVLTFIVGIVVFCSSWKIGVLIAALGGGFYYWGGRVKFNDAKKFADNLIREATLNPLSGGYAGLCANYIAGIVQIVSPSGSAHWPQYPSNVISGERTFIPT
jgi:hypothetical protein